MISRIHMRPARRRTLPLLATFWLIGLNAGALERAWAQGDLDAPARALIDRLTADHAAVMVVIQKKAGEREQVLFAELEARDRELRARQAVLRRESAARVAIVAELTSVTSALEISNRARHEAIAQLAARDRQFEAEIGEYRRQMASLASSPDPRKRQALQQYADGDRDRAFPVLVDLQRAATRARELGDAERARADAAGWTEVATLGLDRLDRGEATAAEVIPLFEEAQRIDPGQDRGWLQLARLYQTTARWEDSMRAAQQAFERASDDAVKAASLLEIGTVLAERGDLAGARTRYEQALALMPPINRSGAGGTTQRNTVMVIEYLASIDRQAGDVAAATRRLEEVLFYRRGLASVNPSSDQAQRDLAGSLNNLADLRASAGDAKAAIEYLEEAAVIARAGVARAPSSATVQELLLTTLLNLGDVLREAGDAAAARPRLEEALAIARRLAAADPGNTEVQQTIERVLLDLGGVLRELGESAASRERLSESVDIARRLALAAPSSAVARSDLGVAIFAYGLGLLHGKDLAGARPQFEEALAVLQPPALPANARTWSRVADVLHRLIEIALRTSDMDAVRARLRERVAVSQQLRGTPLVAAPLDEARQLTNLAERLRSEGHTDAAIRGFETSLSITRQVTAGDPASVEARRLTSFILGRLGDVVATSGDAARARPLLEESIAIHEDLPPIEKPDASVLRNILLAHGGLARMGLTDHWLDALLIAEDMKARGMLAPDDLGIIDYIREQIGPLEWKLVIPK
jgi:tetratricopeptide (TPR) repeat protein